MGALLPNIRGELIGFLGIIAALPVLGILKLSGVKHDYDLMEMAAFMIVGIPSVVIPALIVCRFFGFWPFSN